MISVQEKLDIFRQELSQQVDELRKKEIKRAKAIARRDRIKAKTAINEQKESIKNRYKKLEERNVGRLVAQARVASKDDILRCEKEIRDNFILTIEETMRKLLNSKIYQNYLEKNLKSLNDFFKSKSEIVLYVLDSERDRFEKLAKKLLPGKRIIYKTLPSTQIGGFYARDTDERVNYDFSLLNLIQENDQFIIQKLNDALEENV